MGVDDHRVDQGGGEPLAGRRHPVGAQAGDEPLHLLPPHLELGVVARMDRDGIVGGLLHRSLEDVPLLGGSQLERHLGFGLEPLAGRPRR